VTFRNMLVLYDQGVVSFTPNPSALCLPLECYFIVLVINDRLCGLVVRILGCRSGGPGSIPGTTRKKSSGSGTGSTQPREYN
jgi:hypothetical protein